jgi:hypothetical protein
VINPAISARLLTNADTTWLSAMFHPRSRNDQGDYCRQADLMSAQRLVCLRHDAESIRFLTGRQCFREQTGKDILIEFFST